MYNDILIPTDGREETHEAIEPGLELASQHGATVHILHVIENNLVKQAFSLQTVKSKSVSSRKQGEKAVMQLENYTEQYGVDSVTWVLRARPGLGTRQAHETIVEYAETNEVDLIVMGATDRGRLSTLVRPSLTQRVLASTDIPVFGRRLSREVRYVSDRSVRFGSGSEAGD